VENVTVSTLTRNQVLLVLRVTMGIVFLYAGLEKVFGFGTPDAFLKFDASGFLAFGTLGTWPGAAADAIVNPTHGFWVSVSKDAGWMGVINFLVPFGQVCIGLSLILGLATRFAAAMGTLMMALFFIAAWDFGFGVINQHFVYGIVTAGLGIMAAGEAYGLDAVLDRSEVVTHTPVLRYVLG